MWKKIKEKYKGYTLPFVCITFYVVISLVAQEIKFIANVLNVFLKLISPFVWGFGLAFLLVKPMKFFEKILLKFIKYQKLVRVIATLTAIASLFVVVGLVIVLIAPQIFSSVERLTPLFSQIETQINNITDFLYNQYNIDLSTLAKFTTYQNIVASFVNSSATTKAITYGLNFSASTLRNILNVLISVICAMYLLIDKEKFQRYIKKINYAVFNKQTANNLVSIAVLAKNTFNNFIIGKLIDSLIIGILCYIGMLIFRFEYAVLISFVVGITNVIPVFGPFIGGIPGVVILTLVNPMMGLWFALFVFVLQQFDGNILGPYILGDKLGLPSIGILISVVIGGGLFGFMGMLLGVPVFAIIYELSKRKINEKLQEKEIIVE